MLFLLIALLILLVWLAVAACLFARRMYLTWRQTDRRRATLEDRVSVLRQECDIYHVAINRLGHEIVFAEGATPGVVGRALRRVAQGSPWDQNPVICAMVARIAAGLLQDRLFVHGTGEPLPETMLLGVAEFLTNNPDTFRKSS